MNILSKVVSDPAQTFMLMHCVEFPGQVDVFIGQGRLAQVSQTRSATANLQVEALFIVEGEVATSNDEFRSLHEHCVVLGPAATGTVGFNWAQAAACSLTTGTGYR